MQFNKVIGQAATKQHLAEMVQQNRLSHALLFLGKEGAGVLGLALAFAQYIVCEKINNPPQSTSQEQRPSLFGEEPIVVTPNSQLLNPILATDSCGNCSSCKKAQQLIHPDIHFTYPVITQKSGKPPISTDFIAEWREFIALNPYGNIYDWLQFIGAENKQGNITAAECSDIIRKLSLKSYEGSYKILILWMPEYLEKEGNKLLKLIEEPPPDTLFILVAENESLILPTLLSRCQLVKIPPLETSAVANALMERAKLSADQARQIASVCEGNYHEALQIIQHAEEDWQALLRDWLNAILKTGPIAQVKWVEETSKMGREKQKQFLRYFNHLLEQAIHLRVRGNMVGDNTMVGEDTNHLIEIDFAIRLNKIADIAQQQAIIEELDKASYYIERNANSKMLFQALTIKLYHIIADKSLFLTH
ncbi:MAG: ATP-binding protein [Chitinophagaceae bacterium]